MHVSVDDVCMYVCVCFDIRICMCELCVRICTYVYIISSQAVQTWDVVYVHVYVYANAYVYVYVK